MFLRLRSLGSEVKQRANRSFLHNLLSPWLPPNNPTNVWVIRVSDEESLPGVESSGWSLPGDLSHPALVAVLDLFKRQVSCLSGESLAQAQIATISEGVKTCLRKILGTPGIRVLRPDKLHPIWIAKLILDENVHNPDLEEVGEGDVLHQLLLRKVVEKAAQ